MELNDLKQFEGESKVDNLESEYVNELQWLLSYAGYYNSSIDGIPGNMTSSALAQFKKDNWLAQPRVLGESTIEALFEIEGIGSAVHATPQESLGRAITLPEAMVVYSKQPIVPEGHFSWGDATEDGKRVPKYSSIVQNITKSAKRMEDVRQTLGDVPIYPSSWYRTPKVNERVGGVKNSRHLKGLAIDFTVAGIDPVRVYEILDPWENIGLGRATSFTHIDFNRGYRARWRY